MEPIPHELDLGGVFLPPLLVAGLLGLAAAWLTAYLLNRYRMSRFFAYPPLVLVALAVIYTGLISIFLIPA
jgi:Protein of unknown function (DUF1656)